MPKANFDSVAPFYDSLARMVFGNAIISSQKFLAEAIPAKSSVLIAGGGTGNILEIISRRHPAGLHITYADSSAKMISISKTKYRGENEVVFINQPLQQIAQLPLFDIIITPFFLDNFSDQTAEIVFNKLHSHLRAKGLWLFSDFQLSENKRLWQKILLKAMYLFFGLVCRIEASHLPNTSALFDKYKYKLVSAQTLFSEFILSAIYIKTK